jgi:ribosomal protein L31
MRGRLLLREVLAGDGRGETPLVTGSKTSYSALKLDANGDGLDDVYVVNYIQPNQLFVRDSSATGGYVEVGENTHPLVTGSNTRKSRSALKLDANGDGLDDVYVLNKNQPNQLFVRDSSAASGYVEVGENTHPLVTGSKKSFSALKLDANGDGLDDVYVLNYIQPNRLFFHHYCDLSERWSKFDHMCFPVRVYILSLFH